MSDTVATHPETSSAADHFENETIEFTSAALYEPPVPPPPPMSAGGTGGEKSPHVPGTKKFIEPLLQEVSDKYTFFPIVYNDIFDLYRKQVDLFWRPEEVDLSRDLDDWAKLNEDEKYFISMILAFFAASDGIVGDNLISRFYNDVPNSEVRACYSFQMAMEAIHSQMYSLMIETYIKDKEEKSRLFNSIANFPFIKKKAEWAIKWQGDNRSSFHTRLVAFACVEGIFFSGAFSAIYWLKKRGLLPGLTLSNEFISRDEGIHVTLAVMLYSKLQKKLPKKRVHEIIRDAAEIEKEFMTSALPCRLIGMNSDLMCQYIEFVSDRLCLQLGYDVIYGSKNPFDFMDLISIQSKVNFFERTNSEYSLANKKIDGNVFDLDAEF